ncbi:MAG TPA: serine/threonine-protein kinase [Kofleriaceae bacterium]|nr:serine/threonine-protein kinase [Kofleriaceae bacterium]
MGSAEEFGPYVVHEQIGLGGMATVHRAETQGIAGFSKQVALKRMLPNVAADANLVKSFIREARLASHLRHANVAQTYDLGKVGETYFIAMELVPGWNLREILKHSAQTKRNMPLPIALNIVNQICDALDYAHNLCDETGQPLGIVHRDVSPSNIILGEGGVAKLIDFGIAKASTSGMQTMSGTIKGKFSYMAPEYLMGYLDWRGDLFAVGVIAHELLSNKPLFQGKDDMDTLYRVKDMPILPPSRFNPLVPPEIDNIVMTALERDPNRRWQQASAMRSALTTETARLSLVAQNQEIDVWLDQTFAGGADDLEAPEISLGGSTMELSKGSVPDDFLNAAADSVSTLVRPVGSQPIQAQGTPVARDSSPTLGDRPSRQMNAQKSRAESPRPPSRPPSRPSQNVVPRGEFGDTAQNRDWGDDPPTRADASAVDQIAQSSLARRDDQRTMKGAGIDGLSQRTLVSAPPAELLAQQSFTEETVANAAAMRSLADSPLARDESLEAPTLTNTKRATTDVTDADGVAAESRRDEFAQHVDTTPRRPTPRPQPAASPLTNVPKIRDEATTTQDAPPRRDSGLRPSSPSAPPAPGPLRTTLGVSAPPPIVHSGARTRPHIPKASAEIEVGSSAIVAEVSVSDVLADLGHRPTAHTPAKGAAMPMAPKSGGSSFLLMLLVLIVAGGAAAVVYFALPYFT